MVLSFFFINNTRAPQGETLGQMKPLSTRSCNWIFNSFNSTGVILYGGIEMRVELARIQFRIPILGLAADLVNPQKTCIGILALVAHYPKSLLEKTYQPHVPDRPLTPL